MQSDIPPIIQKATELTKLLFLKQKNIPKFERHTIWSECCKLNIQIIQILLSVSYLHSDDRSRSLRQASVKLDTMRIFIRLASECKAIDYRSYLVIQKEIDEIGKMLGGWIKHSDKK